jgi:RHH-type transcriptional regulator, proline utilization regulon repressor / proline dehydrogenase / delta 1-pyrroline-5-carboxylate dehydrogenase
MTPSYAAGLMAHRDESDAVAVESVQDLRSFVGFDGRVTTDALPATDRSTSDRRSPERAENDLAVTERAATELAGSGHTDHERADLAVELAGRLLEASTSGATRSERRRQARLGRLLEDPAGRELILALTDEVLRFGDRRTAARRFSQIVAEHPTRALGLIDRALLRTGAAVAPILPGVVMPLAVHRIRSETNGIVLSAHDPAFADHVVRRRAAGVQLNVNPLGEAILSDVEADARLVVLCERMRRADVDYVSVKVSSLVANLDALAFDDNVDRVCDRLRVLYRVAIESAPNRSAVNVERSVFVNLDMEEYRDLELTVAAFMTVLAEPEFVGIDAGIVLQAYLPDSHSALERLGGFADRRRRGELGGADGAGTVGGRIKVRLVKGANLAMEVVEAEVHGWVPATYPSKADVDASFKAMLDSMLRPEWADCLRIGLASHNLFDIAWAMVVGREANALDRIEFEMLEGMAPAQARAVQQAAGSLLMYVPVVADDDFDASLAYLSRRLDENTQPDNFLRALFTLTAGSAEFERQADRFRASVIRRHDIERGRRRWRADRPDALDVASFVNEPDSDLTDPNQRRLISEAFASRSTTPTTTTPTTTTAATTTTDAVDQVIEMALAAVANAALQLDERRRLLLDTASLLRRERVAALTLMAHTAGKTVREADGELSEAVDFCEYYGRVGVESLRAAGDRGLDVRARGVVLVVAPWNFPLAIAVGGIAAALAAGNSVVFKPAPEVRPIGAWLTEQFWQAGVPRNLLQLVVCDDDEVGQRLVSHPAIDTVVLTGSYDTAAMFLGWRPQMRLLAETSGKNALVITAAADLDLAIVDLLTSAFGHAGQKCSAASLAIVEATVYDDPSFRSRLRDAVASIRVGSPIEMTTMMGPLIAPLVPSGPLERALTTLEPGEEWLVEPRAIDTLGNRNWTPGVRIGVEPGSWFHRTECFGPVLGVMRATDLRHAIELQNASAFGLTGGIHSLDPGEVDEWLDAVEVGNAYVNRAITGAIVQRQPFGGWKRSSVGGGAKAGGPSYVAQFANFVDRFPGDSGAGGVDAGVRNAEFGSYERAWAEHYLVASDMSGLRAESNVLRYVPLRAVGVVHDGSTPYQLDLMRTAARVTGVELHEWALGGSGNDDPRDCAERPWTARLRTVERVRLLCDVTDAALRSCHEADVAVDVDAPVADGLVELRHWVREQSVTRTMHRHGRVVTSVSRSATQVS